MNLLSTINCAARRVHRLGLSLLEMMVAITLLAVIMIGLLAMFQHTQKALHIAHSQSDVFENVRGAVQMIARDLSEMTAFGDSNQLNVALMRIPSSIPELILPSGTNQPLNMNEAFWLSRVNDEWQGVGYYVSQDPVARDNSFGVGTLYRFTANGRRDAVQFFDDEFLLPQPTNSHRVSDGIVHLSFEAVFVDGTNQYGEPLFGRRSNVSDPLNQPYAAGPNLPAFVEVELGVLEPATLKQFQAIASLGTPQALASAQSFLTNHVGQIHFFRERVPIRNFINPYRANEVP